MKLIALILTIVCTINGPTAPDYIPKPSKGANGPMDPK